ncbi:MAG: winged helix-turn-helix transcriptional regulator [Acidimicrobiia bacterium]|nr:winged helix-turn-helix transcriptional regulator [Acidimicrobiia bacterium]
MGHVSPLFRSETLVGVLALLFLEPGPWTAEELAERSGAAYATVTKEVRRLQHAGLITVTTSGRQKFLAPDRSDAAARALVRLLQAATKGGDPMAKKKDKKKK